MATVTGFTAARMLIIENSTIVDGDVVGDNLILKRRDLATIDAGSVRGPTGSPGISLVEFNAGIEALCPAGTVRMAIAAVADSGWLLLNGQTVIDAQTLYPTLWAKLPATYKVGSSFVTPNMNNTFPIGGTPGLSGGSNAKTILQANLPAVGVAVNPPATTVSVDPPATTVSIDPPSTAVTGRTTYEGIHRHTSLVPPMQNYLSAVVGTWWFSLANVGAGNGWEFTVAAPTTAADWGGDHDHGPGTLAVNIAPFNTTVDIAPFNINVDIAQFNSNNLGSGTPIDITPAWVSFSFQIKAH